MQVTFIRKSIKFSIVFIKIQNDTKKVNFSRKATIIKITHTFQKESYLLITK
jgi:isocitrate dehydrogenase